MDFILGYGSLMNSESQNITASSFNSQPVKLIGYKRSWSIVYDELNFCALGIKPDRHSTINAVLFSTDNIEAFDKREHGYKRIQIDNTQVLNFFDNKTALDKSVIWTYIAESYTQHGQPSQHHLIWQSYLDVIIMGCLEHGDQFTHHFFETTSLWSKDHFYNDRILSTYLPRLKNYNPQKIDQLLLNKFSNHDY